MPNQSRFYPRFDQIVLLSASPDLTVRRLKDRTDNPYGKSAEDVAEVLRFKATIEPLLRSGATHEIDTARPLADVIAKVVEIAGC